MVCLGAGIISGFQYDVITTVNQDIDYKGSTFTYLADGNRKVLILENTRNLQAVWHSELGIWQMIFHAKGQYRDSNIRIKVDVPCALMVSRKADGKVWLHIADPLQKEQIINLELKVDRDMKKTKKLSCNFTHMGEEAGKTKAFLLN